MQAIVRIALERPYTFVVMSLAIMIGGISAIIRLPVDIFPNVPIPVVAATFLYTGLSPQDVAARMLGNFERTLSTAVNDVERVETQAIPGVGVIKVYLHQGADVRLAASQITAFAQTALRFMPPGATPPFITVYNASTVPVIQFAVSGEGMNEQQIGDLTTNNIRPQMVSVPGAAIPAVVGGRQRQIMIDINPQALHAKGLSATDVNAAMAAQTQINPAGNVKIGERQYAVRLNNAPGTIEELNALPIKTTATETILMRDVANVRDGSPPQQSVVHIDGQRSSLISVMKTGATSTLSVVQGVKDLVPEILKGLPSTVKIKALTDQSIFVQAAVMGVVVEGAIAAILTSLLILLFLGSWRSTVIIALSIPLSVMGAVGLLAVFGETLNLMTLGGLALAIGILVDDATVTIENINWHLEKGKDVRTAILDGAQQIVAPAFVSMMCICIAFVPMFFLPGLAGFLFQPMALSVIFAMVTSFLLSRTLVPTMAMYLLKPHAVGEHEAPPKGPAWIKRIVAFQRNFEARFHSVRAHYKALLTLGLGHRKPFVIGFAAIVLGSGLLVPFLGRDFFPSVDSGSIVLHIRAPVGTRLEETSVLFGRVAEEIRKIIPPNEIVSIADNIGVPGGAINIVYNTSGTSGAHDGDMYITLSDDHKPTGDYIRTLRAHLPNAFPAVSFSFLPPDMVSQILNFGTPSPINIQIAGRDFQGNSDVASMLLRKVRLIPGVADARIHQSMNYQELRIETDRTRMAQAGITERDVTSGVAGAVAGSNQTSPVFWLDPRTGISYSVTAQTPERQIGALESLESIPVNSARGTPQILGGLGEITRGVSSNMVSRVNNEPLVNIYATTQGRDLGAVASDIRALLKDVEKDLPPRVNVSLKGQAVTMDTAFTGLLIGLIGAIVLIYLLIVVNFQSWSDPMVIITALPGALVGIVWMLFATGTTLSVPALTGAIMCMGVSTANSILVISFARERLAVLGDAAAAALDAGVTRFRPVIMTALAMIIGMMPMALGLGEGGEQNAPLGRAVIGGLLVATLATLFFVPVVFSIVHGRKAAAGSVQGNAYA